MFPCSSPRFSVCPTGVASMTIGWGTLGVDWSMPVFIAFIREGRYTRELLDASREFTVNVPCGPFDRKILGYCGSHSGRDVDKAAALGLTLVPGELVGAPAIRELPLTLECKVLYRQLQDRAEIPASIRSRMYPEDVDGSQPMKILCESGLVASRQDGKWTHYRLSPEGRDRAVALLQKLTTPGCGQSCDCCG